MRNLGFTCVEMYREIQCDARRQTVSVPLVPVLVFISGERDSDSIMIIEA